MDTAARCYGTWPCSQQSAMLQGRAAYTVRDPQACCDVLQAYDNNHFEGFVCLT